MEFTELPEQMQDEFIQLLTNHIDATDKILCKHKFLFPMLRIHYADAQLNEVIGLQQRDGKIDVDTAYIAAKAFLKNKDFECALFSYSTQIVVSNGRLTDALKTTIIMKSSLASEFFTPFSISGIFKKKVTFAKSLLGNTT